MKVLWFTNTPCSAAKKLNPKFHIGGWLTSLEQELVETNNLKLSICFYWGVRLAPFNFGKTTYYPLLRAGEGSKTGRLINRAFQLNDDKKELKQLLQVIELVQPDVIHIHGTENNFGLIQSQTNIPVVLSIQGILSVYHEKYFSGIPLVLALIHERMKPKLLFRSVRFMYKNLQKWALRERKIFSQTKHVIGRTDWDRRISRLLAPSSRYYVGNEILRGLFYTAKWDKKQFENPLQLVTVMSGGLYKGLETIVKTAILLSKEIKFPFKWIIIGQEQSSDNAKIVKRWLQVDYDSLNIIMVGSKNETEVVDILLRSDIFCQVSHIENSPNSLCEAMLLGMPAIATFAGGTESILENRREGILIQDGDAYSLAGTIIEMSQNFSKAYEYGSEAYKRAKIRHNKKNIACQLVNTYRDVLHSQKN